MIEVLLWLVALVLVLGPTALIVQKAGYSPFWVLIGPIPVVNYLALVAFALTEWPIERELRQNARRHKSPVDAKVEVAWELSRLEKRVALLKQLAGPDGLRESAEQLLALTGVQPVDYLEQTIESLQTFLETTQDDTARTSAEDLLNAVRLVESEIRR